MIEVMHHRSVRTVTLIYIQSWATSLTPIEKRTLGLPSCRELLSFLPLVTYVSPSYPADSSPISLTPETILIRTAC
jgi:hypothetical protein